jgi:hypothetical protein
MATKPVTCGEYGTEIIVICSTSIVGEAGKNLRASNT